MIVSAKASRVYKLSRGVFLRELIFAEPRSKLLSPIRFRSQIGKQLDFFRQMVKYLRRSLSVVLKFHFFDTRRIEHFRSEHPRREERHREHGEL